ncbi:hypothetical protein D3C76_1812040 [compost metagenome]
MLDVPQLDRLYGELNKLHQLAEQPLSEDEEQSLALQDARIEQARAIEQNRAWKHLLKSPSTR